MWFLNNNSWLVSETFEIIVLLIFGKVLKKKIFELSDDENDGYFDDRLS